MASLTPGVLSKLLQNLGNTVAGDHRSPLLQVIGILPSLLDADPWKTNGFFLRVSDSMHSAYVSISDDDVDLILSDKIQLGQFIHVARLDSASPVPVLRGVKPLPRRRACVGEPKDLISSDSLPIRTKLDFSEKKKKKKGSKIVKRAEANTKIRRSVCEDSKPNRLSIENGESKRSSLDSVRRGWDRIPSTTRNPQPVSLVKSKETTNSSNSPSDVQSSRKASSEKDSAMKRLNLSISPLKNKNQNISQKSISKLVEKDLKSSSNGPIPSHLTKVPLSFRTWSDRKISWDLLPHTIHDIGKEAMGHRNLAFLAAVHALEEASAAECVVRCMSMFEELCQSSQKGSAGQLVEQFLNLHKGMQKAAAIVNTLLSTSFQEPKTSAYSKRPLPEICENFPNKNAASWVLAAVETDLSNFCLFRKEDQSENSKDEKSHFVVLDNESKKSQYKNHSPQNKRSPGNHGSSLSESRAKATPPIRRCLSTVKKTEMVKEWSKGSGLKEAASLAEKLLLVSRTWFLDYLEDSLSKGFGLKIGEADSEIASLLRQLKRVNEWLDDSVTDGIGTDGRIEGLRKKLYGFLLEHVDSAFVATS
ncbi:hypothetical protein LOK49_LG02G01208 [Camellia lanceoleosa]|uniref:Uncharacterized protein n=1 Tax=Camellia lanceoleosa TaxID=1840588 RepID=A0ACC0IPC9_9ERIC|nr:hypothetical protein LOK49_LG02G01208 [Camellia lanceoleosa]